MLFSIADNDRAMSILEALIAAHGSDVWSENLDGLLVLLEAFASDLKLHMVMYY